MTGGLTHPELLLLLLLVTVLAGGTMDEHIPRDPDVDALVDILGIPLVVEEGESYDGDPSILTSSESCVEGGVLATMLLSEDEDESLEHDVLITAGSSSSSVSVKSITSISGFFGESATHKRSGLDWFMVKTPPMSCPWMVSTMHHIVRNGF